MTYKEINEAIADYCHANSNDCTTHWHDGNYTLNPNDMLGAERVLTEDQLRVYKTTLDSLCQGHAPSLLQRAETFVSVINAIHPVNTLQDNTDWMNGKHGKSYACYERPPRTSMACEGCGCYSSTRMCWNCSTNPLQHKVHELEHKLAVANKALDDQTNGVWSQWWLDRATVLGKLTSLELFENKRIQELEQKISQLEERARNANNGIGYATHEEMEKLFKTTQKILDLSSENNRLRAERDSLIDALLPLRLIYAEQPTGSSGDKFEGGILTKSQVRDMQDAINRSTEHTIKII
jgi:hypothetical protein